MKKLAIALFIIATLTFSCTQNHLARKWGGTQTIELKKGEQLINLEWKGADLWILTKERPNGQAPKTYTFQESSNLGIMEGKIVLKEQ